MINYTKIEKTIHLGCVGMCRKKASKSNSTNLKSNIKILYVEMMRIICVHQHLHKFLHTSKKQAAKTELI